MSYYEKYRPKEFKEVLANKAIIEALEAKVQNNQRPHTYMFTGLTGSGKTTFAGILAKALTVNSSSIHNYNCSDDNGIDTAREIIDKTKNKPLVGGNSVYILNETQKTTKAFQNGMLDVLENPPNHVYFILCTTDPAAMLSTVKSRCIIYKTEIPKKAEMVKLLCHILTTENKSVSRKVLSAIVDKNECLPRACISVLESVIDIEDVEEQLNIVNNVNEEFHSIELCRALLNRITWPEIQIILKNMVGDPEGIRRHVLAYAKTILLSPKNNDRAALIIDCFLENYYDSGSAGLVYSCYNLYLD